MFVGEDARTSSTCTWPLDLPEHARYRPAVIDFEVTATLPPWEPLLVDELALTQEQLSIYMDLCETLSGDDAWSHRGLLGGHPDQIQGDMTVEYALVTAGLYCGDAKAYQDPRLPQFRRDALDWRLLIQIPSAEEIGMTWGDAGCLYFWIPQQDLSSRNFAASWMILQFAEALATKVGASS